VRTYYFDRADGVPIRDTTGLDFSTAAGAIEYSKKLALRFGKEQPLKDPDLCIVVLDESGSELHRERVYPVDE
jgi:hypothetical protein